MGNGIVSFCGVGGRTFLGSGLVGFLTGPCVPVGKGFVVRRVVVGGAGTGAGAGATAETNAGAGGFVSSRRYTPPPVASNTPASTTAVFFQGLTCSATTMHIPSAAAIRPPRDSAAIVKSTARETARSKVSRFETVQNVESNARARNAPGNTRTANTPRDVRGAGPRRRDQAAAATAPTARNSTTHRSWPACAFTPFSDDDPQAKATTTHARAAAGAHFRMNAITAPG